MRVEIQDENGARFEVPPEGVTRDGVETTRTNVPVWALPEGGVMRLYEVGGRAAAHNKRSSIWQMAARLGVKVSSQYTPADDTLTVYREEGGSEAGLWDGQHDGPSVATEELQSVLRAILGAAAELSGSALALSGAEREAVVNQAMQRIEAMGKQG